MNRLVGSCNCTLSYWISVIFISFFLLFPVSFLSSQTLLRQDKDCILGNEIQVKKQVGYIDGSDGLKGLNVLWDFSTWKTINENYTIKSFNTGLNSVSKYEHRTFYDYQLEDDTLFLCGYKNSTAHVSYPLPEVSLIYPLGYGDSISSYFYGVGNYSSRVGLKVYGKKEIRVDGLGTLVLPSGDTVPNVIRVHSGKIMQYQFGSEIFLESDPLLIPPTDSIIDHLCSGHNLIKTDVFEWYMEGYCKPVFEMIKNTSYQSGNPYKYFSTAFYRPVEEPDNLNDIRTRSGKKTEKDPQTNTQSDEIFNFNPSLDAGKQNILLEYNSVEGATVDVMLFDIQGRLLFHDNFREQYSGKYHLCIDISRYTQTEFVVRLAVNEKIYSRKIFVK